MGVGYLVLTPAHALCRRDPNLNPHPHPHPTQEERISATKARKAGEIALKAAEQVRGKAQDTAQQLKEGSEQRLVKQLAAQRYV
tara:strand:+ start:121 stop:372 length:252 start_codon:yes stop_codon:yes gene_type:complete